jgi:hypothetical protein
MALDPFIPGQVPLPAYRPRRQPSNPPVAQTEFRLPQPVNSAPTHVGFEQATRQFGESIQALSPADRKEIQIIHQAVDQWIARNPKEDRLGQFVFRVMDYSHKRLEQIERTPGTKPDDCKGLERVFMTGYQMVEVYAAL